MDAILLAGGVPAPDSPLYTYTQGKPKAALELGGKLMIQWVLDALEEAETISSISLVGCEELTDELVSSKIVSVQAAAGDMLENFRRGAEAVLEHNPGAKSIVFVSSDIPLITSESVNWVVNTSLPVDLDVYYPVIEQSLMEKRFPESARSFVKLKGMNVCGGDLAIINLELHKSREDFWRRIIEARKSYLSQAALVGFDVLFLLLLRQINLPNLVEKVTTRLNISGRALICPYPELGMDVDKPHQVDMVRKELT